MSGVFATVDPNNRTSYSPYVQPRVLDWVKCIVVDKKFRDTDPDAYRFLKTFAASNELLTENAD